MYKILLKKIYAMTVYDTKSLLKECQTVLQYYLNKTESVMSLYQDTAETQYFLVAIKGTLSYLNNKEQVDMGYLKKCINGLIAGQKGRGGSDRLSELRQELEEELLLLKLRYNIK